MPIMSIPHRANGQGEIMLGDCGGEDGLVGRVLGNLRISSQNQCNQFSVLANSIRPSGLWLPSFVLRNVSHVLLDAILAKRILPLLSKHIE